MNFNIPIGGGRTVNYLISLTIVDSLPIVDYLLNPTKPQATEKKYFNYFEPNLDDFFGIGAIDKAHPVLKQINPKGIESKADPPLDEAIIQCCREAEGLSPYYG